MKKLFFLSLLSLSATVLLVACLKKEYNPPPDNSKNDPALPVNLTIAQLKKAYAGAVSAVQIDSNWTIYGIITADDRSGNFYKQITIEDSTGGITIQIDGNSLYTKLPVGRKVYVKLKGLFYGFYNKLPQVGYALGTSGSTSGIPYAMLDNFVVRANYPNPVPVTKFNGLAALQAVNNGMLNRLVEIDSVEIIADDLGKTYAQPSTISSGTSITIKDCNGKTIVLRNSAYANFQSYTVPSGKGKITALYTTYNATPQLVIRDTSDLQLYGNRCDGSAPNAKFLLNDPFDNLNNWTIQNVSGTQTWSIATYGNPKPCGFMSGFEGGTNYANEDWLISKPLNLSGYNKISFQFDNAGNYSGNPLECYISTDYTGTGLPSTATWTLLPAVYDNASGFVFTNSGVIDLSSYKNKTVYIAFKYTSTASAASSWELDNVKVSAE